MVGELLALLGALAAVLTIIYYTQELLGRWLRRREQSTPPAAAPATANHSQSGSGSGRGSEDRLPTTHERQSGPGVGDAPRPAGTVTFLFTDIEGSTRLWEQHGEAMRPALARHDTLLRQAIEARGGYVFKTVGDAFCAAFATAPDALAAAITAQRALEAESWGETGPLRVRMALHTGAVEERDGDYFGPPLNRVSRLLNAGHGGQILLSLAAQELVRDHLPVGADLRDLGEYRLKDLSRPQRIFQLVAADRPADFPRLNTLDARRHNLPVQPTALIGREREVGAARELVLREVVRLVTFTGAGGTGKTRLALQVAADLIDSFPDGVFVVTLAPLSDPALVASTIAQTLGVQEAAGLPLLKSLREYLHEKQMLLVLDNFEQVLPAAPLVAALLETCPRLTVLVTTREPLHLRGEQEFPVPPLSVPDPKHLPGLPTLSQYAAVELFIQRALNVNPDFAVTNANSRALAEICHRLDGLPLAIELAAAQVKLFPPKALLSRLESRLKALTGGARDLPDRHRTLRGAIAWSYDLLEEPQKSLFRRLCSFVGGCTLEAAEAVWFDAPVASSKFQVQGSKFGEAPTVNLEPSHLEQDEVLPLLASLVDKSLIWQEEQRDGQPRIRMLETIQEYGLERLAGSGEAEATRRQHAQFFLALAERAEPELTGADQVLWLERLEREHDNFRAALEWNLAAARRAPARRERAHDAEPDEAEAGLRLAGALGRFWQIRGHFTEGRDWLTRALAANSGSIDNGEPAPFPGPSGKVRNARSAATALSWAGFLALYQGDYAVTRRMCEESLALWRELGDRNGIASALGCLAVMAKDQGDPETARALFEETLALWRETGDATGIAGTLGYLGILAADREEYASARAFYEESLAIRRQTCDRWGIAASLNNLGLLALYQDQDAPARALLEESLAIRRQLGARRCIAVSLNNLGLLAWRRGDEAAARALLTESLTVAREIWDRRSIAYSLEAFARLAAAQGRDADRAAKLCGAAEALRETIGSPLPRSDRARHEECLGVVRAALPEPAFAALRAEGRAMELERAIACALEEPGTPPPAS